MIVEVFVICDRFRESLITVINMTVPLSWPCRTEAVEYNLFSIECFRRPLWQEDVYIKQGSGERQEIGPAPDTGGFGIRLQRCTGKGVS